MEYLVEFEGAKEGEGPSWHSSTALQSDSALDAIKKFEAKLKQKNTGRKYKEVYASMGYKGYGEKDSEAGRRSRSGKVVKK